MPDEGATIYIRTKDSVLIDSMSFSEKQHAPLLNEEGTSLEKIHTSLSSEQASHWRSNDQPTPSRVNGQFQPLYENKNNYSLKNNVIHHSNPFQNFLEIVFPIQPTATYYTFSVFTESNYPVYQHQMVELQFHNKSFIWYPIVEDQLLTNGLYYLVLDVFNENGETDRQTFLFGVKH